MRISVLFLVAGGLLLVGVQTNEAQKLGVGAMTTARWSELIQQMEKVGLIKAGSVDAKGCFRWK